jgi:molybdenum cofactor biosynthesis enzyme MoaA
LKCSEWPHLQDAVELAKVLEEHCDADRIFPLGDDLRETLPLLAAHCGIKEHPLLTKFSVKRKYQDAIYHEVTQPSSSTYLSVVGHWSMLTSVQMEKLIESRTKENAIIGPPAARLTLPGLLQRVWVNAKRSASSRSPLTSFVFPNDPPIRFVSFGDLAFLQVARPREHMHEHEELRGHSAKVFVDLFRQMARRSASAEDSAAELLREITEENLGSVTFSGMKDEQVRVIHRAIIDAAASAIQETPEEILDPNLHEFTDKHLKTVLAFLAQRRRPDLRSAYRVMDSEPLPAVPDMRFILTSVCRLKCPFCPDGNEDFQRGDDPDRIQPTRSLPIVASAAERCGVGTIALTGGEPTNYKNWTDVLAVATKPSSTDRLGFQIQTAGIGFAAPEARKALLSAQARLRVKLSIDPGHRQTNEKAEQTISSLLAEGFPRNQIEVNYVCDAVGLAHLKTYIQKLARFGVSLKLLDLLWYGDMGNRLSKRARYDFLTSYVDMHRVRDVLGRLHYELLGEIDKNLGVVEEIYQNKVGHRVRLRDSAKGTTYGDRCTTCDHYATGNCQEGIYQLEITSDLRCKICRHRPDLTLDISRAVRDDLASQSTTATQEALKRAFAGFFSGIHRARKFMVPQQQR